MAQLQKFGRDTRTSSWGQIGHMLLEVERRETWNKEADSFTHWIKLTAAKLGHKESALWRYFSSSRFYEELRSRLQKEHIPIPRLEDVSHALSAESIELLSKLSRVVPAHILTDLSLRLIHGRITRAELRAKWQAFRPVLGGRTARGRGVAAPRFNPSDRAQKYSQLEGVIVAALATDWQWSGVDHPNVYQVFQQVQPDDIDGPRFRFDVVVAVRPQSGSPLILHGIEVVGLLTERFEMFERRAPYCDALWLAAPKEIGEIPPRTVPDYVGILRLGPKGMLIERPAQRSGPVGTQVERLAKGVLLKCFHR